MCQVEVRENIIEACSVTDDASWGLLKRLDQYGMPSKTGMCKPCFYNALDTGTLTIN